MGIESVFNRVSDPSWVFGGSSVFGGLGAAAGNLNFDVTPAAIGVSGFMGIGIPSGNIFAASFALASSIGRMPGGRPPGFPAYFGQSPYGPPPPPPQPTAPPAAAAPPPPPAAAGGATDGEKPDGEKAQEPEKKEEPKKEEPAAPPPAAARPRVDHFAQLKWTEAQRRAYPKYVAKIRAANAKWKGKVKIVPTLQPNGGFLLTFRKLRSLTAVEADAFKTTAGQLVIEATALGFWATFGNQLPEATP
ncbi:MAG: hypothetical protein HY696_00790 [Deltaproteobacteria bacterium]|nr:hypothetical protein [Deltaproteobacteria bacterium]